MTDGAMFYPMFKILQEFYVPKINNADIYLDFFEKIYDEHHEFENIYQDYTKLYNKKEFDWMYYYLYVILFIDFESTVDREMYEKIIADMIVVYEKMEENI
jgi:thiol-disulfide isomerase/thioredoxin